MAPKDVKTKSTKTAPPRTEKRGRKWRVGLLLLLIIVGAALGLDRFNFLDLPYLSFSGNIPVLTSARTKAKKPAVPSESVPRPKPQKSAPPPDRPPAPETPQPPPPPKPTKTVTPSYYLKIGTCLYLDCLNQTKTVLKQNRLPLVEKKRSKSTRYFELISQSAYSRRRAEEKIHILNRYNKMSGFPYLVQIDADQYKISFGQFPEMEDGVRMRSHLAQLYPQVKTRFLLVPKTDRYTVVDVYTGPFSRTEVNQIKDKLKADPRFETVEVTSQL